MSGEFRREPGTPCPRSCGAELGRGNSALADDGPLGGPGELLGSVTSHQPLYLGGGRRAATIVGCIPCRDTLRRQLAGKWADHLDGLREDRKWSPQPGAPGGSAVRPKRRLLSPAERFGPLSEMRYSRGSGSRQPKRSTGRRFIDPTKRWLPSHRLHR